MTKIRKYRYYNGFCGSGGTGRCLQPVFEQAFGSSAMVQDLYLLDVLMNIYTDEVTPDIRNHDNGK